MVILNAVIHRKWHYAETWPEMEILISEALENLESEGHVPYWSPGEDAWFMFSDRRHTDSDGPEAPNNFLRIAVNSTTGFGALIWFATDGHKMSDSIRDQVWVSNNPNPPNFDPRVVSDPGEPRFHDRRSALPVTRIRAAVEEFCRRGTGQRPMCIEWTPGDLAGRRGDTPEPETLITQCEDPWCEIPDAGHPAH
ncbi:Imm1 family immunity protein [Streptomyces gardneri]|uniref:Imm1 family immunity protein n=1 Tax=Streptomyces gardneri TaxID=66892 RepID=UPI0033C694B7